MLRVNDNKRPAHMMGRALYRTFYTNLNLKGDIFTSGFFVRPRRRPAGLVDPKPRDFNAGMAEKTP